MNDLKRLIIVLLLLTVIILPGFGIREKINNDGKDRAHIYNTAIQANEKDRFNYALDSRQGNLLAHGSFKAVAPANFPEMTQGFAEVHKIQYEYTRHESCSSDSNGNQSCSTYYTWDRGTVEITQSPTISLYGREYPTVLFDLKAVRNTIDPCGFTAADTSEGWFADPNGCKDGHYYIDGNTRYDYDVVPVEFSGSFLANVSDGWLKPMSGSKITLQNKSIDAMVKEANNYELPGNIFFIAWCIILMGGAGYLAYWWTYNY